MQDAHIDTGHKKAAHQLAAMSLRSACAAEVSSYRDPHSATHSPQASSLQALKLSTLATKGCSISRPAHRFRFQG